MSAHQMAMETQQELRRLPGNNRCVDCDAPYPQWATVSYGTFMCLECSGRHRGLGVHISFVRSVTMDSWTDKQIRHMQLGGNDTFREAFASVGVPSGLSIQEKYNTPQAEAYRARLSAKVNGSSAATPLPQWTPSSRPASASSSAHGSNSGNGGDSHGVEALKGESEQDYVARQLKLRDEARARMQAKFGSGGMQGIGSGGQTSPMHSGGGASSAMDLGSAFGYLTSTVSSAATSAVSLVKDQDLGSKVSTGWSYVQSTIADPALSSNVKSTASTGWSALSSGASAVWQRAQTVVDATGATAGYGGYGGTGGAAAPSLHGSLAPSGKYAGVGSDHYGNGAGNSTSSNHDNDSWLDSQLGARSTSSSSFDGGVSTSASASAAAHEPARFARSSSATGMSLSSSSVSSSYSSASAPAAMPTAMPTTTATATATVTATAAATAAPPAPVAAKEKKKDVDFFAEFGF